MNLIINFIFLQLTFTEIPFSMTFIDKHIYFDKDFQFELIGSTLKKFIVFSIRKTDFQAVYTKDDKGTFETFLLVRVQPDSPLEKNIVFTREKMNSLNGEKELAEGLFLKSESFYCTFLRHVDLLYCRKLAETLENLNIQTQIPIENQWFMLYEVHSYKPVIASLVKYELKPPTYGGKVQIMSQFQQKNTKKDATVSNLFRLGSQNIYFVNDCLEAEQTKDMNLIISEEKNELYGLTYKIKEQILCIPLEMILFQKPCQTIIEENLFNKLQKTCYVEYLGSYCTGILVDENKIITARHLFSKYQEKLGNKVIVKLFPFQQNMVGYVIKIGRGNLDIMEIELLGKQVDLAMKTSQKLKLKHFVKQELIGNYAEQNQQNVSQKLRFRLKFMKTLFKTQEIATKQKLLLGESVTALGFGKINFNVGVFNKFDLVLPTVAVGVVSKIISIQDSDVFLKTDAKLYSGFSGCGIWRQVMVGMAVFILKNKTTNSHHNRHNFSYTAEFIEKLRKTNKNQLLVDFDEKIQEFDRIQTRHEFNLVDWPRAKL